MGIIPRPSLPPSSRLTAGIQDRKTLMTEVLLDVESHMAQVFLASDPSRCVLVQVTERWIIIEKRPTHFTDHVHRTPPVYKPPAFGGGMEGGMSPPWGKHMVPQACPGGSTEFLGYRISVRMSGGSRETD